jgi:acyl-CoA thioesterase YciA
MNQQRSGCKYRSPQAVSAASQILTGASMTTRSEPQGELTLQTIAMPADTNANGDIFGGWLMSQMDLGSSVMARRRARGRVATVAVEGMTFHHPVRVGDVLSIHATMIREGKTSMQMQIEAWILRQPEGERLKVTEAMFVFVAVDEHGLKRPLRPEADR